MARPVELTTRVQMVTQLGKKQQVSRHRKCRRIALVDGTAADWRNSVARVSGPDVDGTDARNGVRCQCRRSLTLVEDALNPVEEIVGIPGARTASSRGSSIPSTC